MSYSVERLPVLSKGRLADKTILQVKKDIQFMIFLLYQFDPETIKTVSIERSSRTKQKQASCKKISKKLNKYIEKNKSCIHQMVNLDIKNSTPQD